MLWSNLRFTCILFSCLLVWSTWHEMKLRKALSLLYLQWPVPQIIIFHLAGNDIGLRRTLEIISLIKSNLMCLYYILQNCILVFSQIIPRLHWLSPEWKHLEKNCKRINRAVTKFMPV